MTRYRPLKTFWEAYAELPAHIQREVRQAFKLFQQGAEHPPFHPSLRIHKMRGYPNIWEGHVTKQIVFTFHIERDPESGETIYVFRNIGTHEVYRQP
jgi:mRNA-degrading endonuclease YafQ of YafQ-DinJ toxin-antitoxin module